MLDLRLGDRSPSVAPVLSEELGQLRTFFHRLGSVEFHGCHVGEGQNGSLFLKRVADLWGVPAIAGINSQHTDDAIRFSGPRNIQVPGAGSFENWGQTLAPVVGSDA